MATIDDFTKLEFKVGKVISCEPVEGSEKLLKLSVDVGEENLRQILSGIAKWYKPEDLIDKSFIFITNLEPRMMMGLESQGMILAAEGDEMPVPLIPLSEAAPDPKLDNMFEILKKACLAAGKLQLEYYNKDYEVSYKELPTDVVTEVDLKSQEVIINSLTDSMLALGYSREEVGFIGEEGVDKAAKHLFIIDPLDGTSSYIEKSGQFSVSIAYLMDDKLLAGMVYDPTNDIIYFAEKGSGSVKFEKNSQSGMQINQSTLNESILTFNTSSSKEVTEKMFRAALGLIPVIKRLRENRSIALAVVSVANNKFQIQMHGRGMVWDIAAAKIIIDEAGGVMTDWDGSEIELDLKDVKKSYAIVATHKELLSEIIELIK